MSTTFGVKIPSTGETEPIARRVGIGNGKVSIWFINPIAELLPDDKLEAEDPVPPFGTQLYVYKGVPPLAVTDALPLLKPQPAEVVFDSTPLNEALGCEINTVVVDAQELASNALMV